MENNEKFTYTYSAPTEAERREIESIRRQYQAQSTAESKVERLRALHSKVTTPAAAVSITVGIIGILIFGSGMALALEFEQMTLGVIVSLIGAIPTAFAYLIYKMLLMAGKKKYGAEILRLSDELLEKE